MRSSRRSVVLLALLAAACGPAGAPAAAPRSAPAATATVPPSAHPTTGSPAAAAGAGLTGRLLQFRRDVQRRRLEVRLTAAAAGLHVEALTLEVPGLPTSEATPDDAALPAGTGLDLPVVMAAADCTVAPGPPVAQVRLRDAAGAVRTESVPLDDDGLVGRLHEEDCADQALRAQADIAVTAVQEERTADGGPALRVTVTLTRRTGDDAVRVTGTDSNTVYTITAAGPLPTLTTGTAALELDTVPSRCDVHALGESYQTGLIGLVVALGERPPRPYLLVPADDVRRQLEGFAVRACRGTP